MKDLIPQEIIEQKILLIRGHKVMLDKDLALLYDVETRNLNKAVSRNIDRFPEDFMISLTNEEFKNLKFHFGTSSWGGTRKMPRAFTEQGVAMLSSILNSKKAIHVNIAIMRVFVKLKEMLSTHKELASKLNELEKKILICFSTDMLLNYSLSQALAFNGLTLTIKSSLLTKARQFIIWPACFRFKLQQV